MFHAARVSTVAKKLRPPSSRRRPRCCSGRPAGPARVRQPWLRAGRGGCSRHTRRRAAAAPRAAALPTESCDSNVPGRGLCRLVPEARGQAQHGPGDSDASERAGEATDKEITSHTKMYLAKRPSTRQHTPSMRRRPRRGRARQRQGSAPSVRQAQS